MKIISLFRAFLTLGVVVGPLPVTLTNGTTADATQVMANFNWLMNQVNANAAPLSGTPTLAQLAASNGSTLIGTIQAGAGTTATTVGAFVNRYPSVSDYGAVGDGTTSDLAALTAAQVAHPTGFIEVNEGFNCYVGTGAGLNYWQFFGRGTVFQIGRTWKLAPYPQTGAMIKGYVPLTMGSYEGAVAGSFTVNTGLAQTYQNTQFFGTNAQGAAFSQNTERPAAAIFASAYTTTPVQLSGATTVFTALTVAHANITTTNTRPGMYIDIYAGAVSGNPAFVGGVQSVVNGIATVDGWFVWGGTNGQTGTPANGKLGMVNYNNKVWGMGMVTYPGVALPLSASVGIEVDVLTQASQAAWAVSGGTNPLVPGAGDVPRTLTWGEDVVSLPFQYMDVGYQCRGVRNISYFSNNASGPGLIGFQSTGDARGVYVVDATVNAIEVVSSAVTQFRVNNLGQCFAPTLVPGVASPLSGAAGVAGQIATDGGYIYVCVASGNWRRVATTGGY